VSGQEPTLTLEEAVAVGLENNLNLKILQTNELIAQNNNSAANAGFLPRISALGTYGFSSTNTKQEFFNGDSRSASSAGSRNARASTEVGWTVFDGFRRQAIKEGLELDQERTKTLINAEALQLIERIQLAYYELGEGQLQIGLTHRSIELNDAVLELALQKQRIGVASESEVLQARNQLNIDSILLIDQQGELQRRKIAFNGTLNRSLSTQFSVETDVRLESLPSQQSMLDEAAQRNPQLLLARLDQLSTDLQIKEIKSVLYPKLDLSATYNYNFSRADVGFLLSNRTFGPSTQATVTYDIFSGRNLKKELQNVDLVRNNLITEEERIKWDIESGIADLYANFEKLLNLQIAEEKNINIAEKNTLLANELYRQGRNTSFEVREAVLREIQARGRLIQSTFNLKYLEIQLRSLAGILAQQ
jgi:outer membrane protein TolC